MPKRALISLAGVFASAALATVMANPAAAAGIGRIGNFTISRPVVTPPRPTVVLQRLIVPRPTSTPGAGSSTGRITGIAVDPSRRGPQLTAGSPGGSAATQQPGVWKTMDGGNTWLHARRGLQLKAATPTSSSQRYYNGVVSRFSQGRRDSRY